MRGFRAELHASSAVARRSWLESRNDKPGLVHDQHDVRDPHVRGPARRGHQLGGERAQGAAGIRGRDRTHFGPELEPP